MEDLLLAEMTDHSEADPGSKQEAEAAARPGGCHVWSAKMTPFLPARFAT